MNFVFGSERVWLEIGSSGDVDCCGFECVVWCFGSFFQFVVDVEKGLRCELLVDRFIEFSCGFAKDIGFGFLLHRRLLSVDTHHSPILSMYPFALLLTSARQPFCSYMLICIVVILLPYSFAFLTCS